MLTSSWLNATARRHNEEIFNLDSNPKGHSNYKFISALLVRKAVKTAISSSRLDLNLNLNVALWDYYQDRFKKIMKKIKAQKLKMTQVWKNDAVVAISPMKLSNDSDFTSINEGDIVKVSANTKGHGFQGVVKRYSFAGGSKTHGQKNRYRAAGSIGSTAPQRVLPGRKMAGRMGGKKKTILGLEVISVDKIKGTVAVRGSVPGTIGGKVTITTE